MPEKQSRTRELRRVAEEYVEKLVEEGVFLASEKSDYATSLVRQFLTYDDHATLFLREKQFYLHLDHSPLAKLRVVSEVAPHREMRQLAEEWSIDPGELPDICARLNRGQSADVTNDKGEVLRIWVDPRERRRVVEPAVKTPKPPGWKPDYRKYAANSLERLARNLDADEFEKLADSIARQWQRYEGHACLFFQRTTYTFVLTENEDGGCVSTREGNSRLEEVLTSHGIPTAEVPQMVARINLGEEIEFRDNKGDVYRLWHDPKIRELCRVPLNAPRRASPRGLAPIFCPRCGAMLRLWQQDQEQQVCPLCRHTVTRT